MNTAEAVEKLKRAQAGAIQNEVAFFGETTIEVRRENLMAALKFLKEACGFETLMDLTGVDYLTPTKRTKVVYWLHNPASFARVRVVAFVEREASLPSVTSLWAGADWYERELWDLFGVKFEGHPDLKRILMPDEWQGHPLRRDYALTEESVEFKHGVKPKVPSKIIPNVPANKKT